MSDSINHTLATDPRAAVAPAAPHGTTAGWRTHALHAGLLALLLVAMFWRVFFLGETLIDVATLDNQLPWGYAAGPVSTHPYNRRDLTDTYVTREYFVAAAYRDGEWPLWNPYTMAGHPIYADGVTRILSPFLLFYAFFDVPLGYTVARLAELLLAAVFMYVFLIRIGVAARGALAGALVFEFSAHSMLHLTGLGWWGGLLWLPLIFLAVDRAVTRRSYAHAILAGVWLAAQFYCGYMPNQIYYVGAALLYYLYLGHRRAAGLAGRERLRAGAHVLGMVAVTLGVGFILAAPQWVPVMELLQYSNRRIVPTENGYIYLPPWYLATLVFPNLFGSAYDPTTVKLFTALNVSHDHILYVSVAALLPLGFALRELWGLRRRGKEDAGLPGAERAVFFAGLLVFALFVVMAAPLYVYVTKYFPVLQTIRVIVRAGVLVLFAAAVLVAFGTDWFLRAGVETQAGAARFMRRSLYAVLAFVLFGVAAAYAVKATGFAAADAGRGKLGFARRAAAALAPQFLPPDAGLLIPLASLAAVALLVWLLARQRITRQLFFAGLMALIVAELFWNAGQFNESFDRARVFPATEITETLRRLPPGRVLVAPSDMDMNRSADEFAGREKIIAPPNTLLAYEIPTLSGKNQLFPRAYREFAALVEPQPHLSHVVFDQTRSPFLDLLDARYVLTHAGRPPLEGMKLLKAAEGVALYENPNAMGRAFLVGRAVETSTPAEALHTLREGFDVRSGVVIESRKVGSAEEVGSGEWGVGSEGKVGSGEWGVGSEGKVGSGEWGVGSGESAQVRIVEARRNRVVIETNSGGDALLVLSDNWYPGWRAAVDGQEVEILRADYTLRAVRVPAGSHVVTFEFAPRVFFVAATVSLAAALAVAAAGLALAIRERRGRRR